VTQLKNLNITNTRTAGILHPVFSLPSPYGNSPNPNQSFSAFAGSPYFTDGVWYNFSMKTSVTAALK